MSKKETLFSKLNLNIKDYNEELEIILDKKKFSEEVQNLILSMFYKIENSYKDFYKVKKDTPLKEEFIQNLISYIDKYCKNIEIIAPTEKKKKTEYKINKKKGEIKCFPNEVVLLYCLVKLACNDNENEDFIEKAVSEMLNVGKSLSYQEVIRDFNGWAWTDSNMSNKEIQYNLVYHNLLLLVGYDKSKKIFEGRERLFLIEKELKHSYNEEIVKEYMRCFFKVSVLLKAYNDKEYKERLITEMEDCIIELEKLSDKEKLIHYIAEKKKNIIKEIKKIDKLINNITELKSDFEKRNKKLPKDKRIYSISLLVQDYEQERKSLLEKLKKYNRLVQPREYIKLKDDLIQKIEAYKYLELDKEKSNQINKNIIELQKNFLKLFEEKVDKCKDKKEIVYLLCNFRYYMLLSYKDGCKIKDCIKLKSNTEIALKKLIYKAEKLKAVEKISDDSLLNMKIFEKIIYDKIINFENITLNIISSEEKSCIKYFDANVLECEFKIKTNKIITKKKKVKLFI